jgi:hypothetical protein
MPTLSQKPHSPYSIRAAELKLSHNISCYTFATQVLSYA